MINKSLWQFSIDQYSQPGMEELCLELQDCHGIEVTILLWSLWLDTSGMVFDETQWLQALQKTADLRKRVTHWRRLRRSIPKWQLIAAVRNWVKHRELSTERQVLELLGTFAKGECGSAGNTEGYVNRCLEGTEDAASWCRRVEQLLGEQ